MCGGGKSQNAKVKINNRKNDMLKILKKSIKTGIVTEPVERDGEREFHEAGTELKEKIRKLCGGRSLRVREVDAGSCNGCELEISNLPAPHYDIERFGVHFTASPRHADVLMVTGPVTRQMETPLRKTYEAAPDPKIVIALGDCAINCGLYAGSYAVTGPVESVIPVDIKIAGCPPNPTTILKALLSAIDRLPEKSK